MVVCLKILEFHNLSQIRLRLTFMDGLHGNQRQQPILSFYAKLSFRGNKLITTYL